MKIGIHGVNGKMGQKIAEAVLSDNSVVLAAASVREHHSWYNKALNEVSDIKSELKTTANLEVLCQKSEVIIDFTRPDATLALLHLSQRYNRPLMIGTTGLNDDIKQVIANAAKNIPIVLAANTSLGVNVLMEITRRVAEVLGSDEWDAEIFEAHHRRKADAPSGTALKLGMEIAKGRGVEFEKVCRYPHETVRKRDGEIGFSVMRGGDICGDHSVFFISEYERVELTHRAQDRSIFARGALKAAKWLHGKKPGLYSMADVLGFNG